MMSRGCCSGREAVFPCRIDSEFLCVLISIGGGGEINIR